MNACVLFSIMRGLRGNPSKEEVHRANAQVHSVSISYQTVMDQGTL